MRVAVTGAGGRLGSAVLAALTGPRSRDDAAKGAPFAEEVLAWDLPEHDLDDPTSAGRLVSAHKPDVVVHTAAWTDVDGCARDPGLALRRNGAAVGELAQACVRHGASLVVISTNEVFDGLRTDGGLYSPADAANPGNPYGAAKLAGEAAARAAFGATGSDFAKAAIRAGALSAAERTGDMPTLAIVRTAWLFGPPGADFPAKILAAAERAGAQGDPLRVTFDEVGSPTYTLDLAAAIVALLREAEAGDGSGAGAESRGPHGAGGRGPHGEGGRSPHGGRDAVGGSGLRGGIHHIVNSGTASRADWAREVLRLAGVDVPTLDVPMATWQRPSTPPAWGLLQPTPLPGGPLRDWRAALADYMARFLRGSDPARPGHSTL